MVRAINSIPRLSLAVPSVWDLLRVVRERVETHLLGVDRVLREATVMAASELVENAIKYGRPVPACPNATLEVESDGRVMTLRISSGVRSEEAARDTVDRVSTIAKAPDKMALYLERMKTLLHGALPGSTQLGLFRICGEGEFDLSCRFNQDVLHLTATREL